MKTNKELDLAWKFVQNTNRNVFLTGRAGTGKTTFLRKLKMTSQKRMVVVAPTGVAAINAKGVTIHSFFQLPFGPILPSSELQSASNFNRKFSKTKINIIKSLDLLVIDEISMVRADVLDGIDKTLRRFKNRKLPFGGTQLLMIGDLQQLSPVVKKDEWQLLKPFYETIFFFSSKAYQNSNPIVIELKQIYRQKNQEFIRILNEIRNNSLSQSSAKILNKCYHPDFVPAEDEGYVSLTTHNHKASLINKKQLEKLKDKSLIYKAIIHGKFPEHAYPNEEKLVLKKGAQVMFVKNDSSHEKRYYNGKIGKIISLDNDGVVVKSPGDDFEIFVQPEVWENINYTLDNNSKEISENKIGSYTQIPLRLAWSITIHKSQGLTFEKAIIDAEAAFAHGQTYVALSRCKSLRGLVLRSRITPDQIISDINVTSFNEHAEANQPDQNILRESERLFQLGLIAEMFNFYGALYPINRILDIYYKHKNSIEGKVEEPTKTLKELVTKLLKVSASFNAQLRELCSPPETPTMSDIVQERFKKATDYFYERTTSKIQATLKCISFITDNKALEKDLSKQIEALETLVATKLLYFNGFKSGFSAQEFLELKSKSVFLSETKTKKQHKTIIEGTANAELFELLLELRNQIANREDVAHFQVFTQKSLYAMCELLPTNKNNLKHVHGMGKKRIERYGDEIIDVITNYCNNKQIDLSNEPSIHKEKTPKEIKVSTKELSLEMYKAGKSISKIAEERGFKPNTIYGHLASFVASGEVQLADLIPEERYNELKEIIPTKVFENLTDLKTQLNDKYDYGELRLVVNMLSEKT